MSDAKTEKAEKTSIAEGIVRAEARDAAVDAQARVVQQKGFLDDVIDGVQLGAMVIFFICLVFVAIFGSSLPSIFPVTQPLYDALVGLPQLLTQVPDIETVREYVPKTLDEACELRASMSVWIAQVLHELAYKQWVLGLSWAMYLWQTKLNIRQRDRLHDVRRPKGIATFISRQVYLEANAYGLDKSSLLLVRDFIGQLQTTAIIAYDVVPWLWEQVGQVTGENVLVQSVGFFVAASVLSTVLGLPFDIYSTFVVEKKHGFNKQTMGLFWADALKSLLLVLALGAPVLAGFLWVIERTGERFYLYAWALMAGVQLLMILIYPTVIQPMFNKFDPLPEGDLREAIEALAGRLEFPLKKLYVVDGSKRSSHSNAYVFGFFKAKRIVIYDTLIEQCTTDEIVAVVGHELGHWKKSHTVRMLLMAQLQILLIFYSFSCFVTEPHMYESFGVEGMPVMLGFLFFQYLYEPLGMVLQFATNVMSRIHEFQADAFSRDLGYGEQLASCLIKLQIENKATMNPDPLYSAFTYSHPPLVERLDALGNPHLASKDE
ncbi:zinc metalloprotease [Coemansia sp. RSA 2523]|nr:zinc metalloprotease [Coemansia sp. RSA 2523]